MAEQQDSLRFADDNPGGYSSLVTAPDSDAKTLHIRCGNDVMYKLAVSGFEGDFLCFADPYIQGPVPAKEQLQEFIQIRADFIAGNHWREQQQAIKELSSDYQALEQASEYQRVAFWFEHDAYDVLIFLKMLHFFRDSGKRAPTMQYICIDQYPGVERFHGIGQLPAEAMPVLWQQFQPLTEAQYEYGSLCWQAYTSPTPEAFSQLIAIDNPPFAAIIPALQRHIRELPWLTDGLNLSERLTLKILSEQGSVDAAKLFYHWYTCVYEPLVFMGDSSYWLILEQLATAEKPAIRIDKASEKKIDWQVSITPFGEQLLACETHWMTHNSYNRWWGGTHNDSGKAGGNSIWYWDEAGRKIIKHRIN
ncbi:MAG: DUF1835 domain-containing protein [Thiolinea sp.]